jgi:hypothetical protein
MTEFTMATALWETASRYSMSKDITAEEPRCGRGIEKLQWLVDAHALTPR